MIDKEEYRIFIHNTNYEVTSFGRLFRVIDKKGDRMTKPRELKGYITDFGYVEVSLCSMGKRKHLKLHRIVATAFVPNPDNKPHINHKDGNKLNNNYLNIEWSTIQENIKHAVDTGLMIRGERVHSAILDEDDVIAIRTFFGNEKRFTPIANLFGVDRNTIRDVIQRVTWRHV